MTAPDVPAWLDCINGALSCQHSIVDFPLAVAMVVMFRWEGTETFVTSVRAGTMDRLKIMGAARCIV